MLTCEKSIFAKCLLLAVIFLGSSYGDTDTFENDITLTAREKVELDQFKDLVLPKIPKTSYIHNYTDDDLYFMRWLRARNFDISAAERSFLDKATTDILFQHLQWRESEKIDSVEEEDWSEYEKEFPAFINTVDKDGRPIAELWYSDWDIRQAYLTGKSRQLGRWVARLFEMQSRRVHDARVAGKEISRAVLINELDGFNVIQQACPACLPFYVNVVTMYENHYPNLWEGIYLVNMPASFELILTLIRPIMSSETVRVLKTYQEKQQWMKVIDEKVAKNQRSVRLGGTIVRNNE